jgi:serine phosphatase RsbU (regulator of sigma subunit)
MLPRQLSRPVTLKSLRAQRVPAPAPELPPGLELSAGLIERERRAATLRMQQAIMPTTDEEFRIGRYEIGVRYTPAQSGNRVGGDWYEARPGPGGAAIVAIGDVAGHGLTAAAGMARIGNALRGLAITREPADKLLSWLNDLVCVDEIPERIASVAIGSLAQDVPRLRWAQAGHPPPVLVRHSDARLIPRPAGLLIGTIPDTDYELATEELAPGDCLVFYTDGLIERRGRDIDVGLVELLDAAGRCRDETPAGFAAELAGRLSPGPEDDVSVLVVRVGPAPPI